MMLSTTLSGYIARRFLAWVFIAFFAIMAIVFLLDVIELVRRSADKEAGNLLVIFKLALLKAPHMGQLILPFAILFGGMASFAQLTRNHELVVARAAGVSVWQFLLPTLLAALVLGLLKITVVNPVASVMTAEFKTLEGRLLHNEASALSISTGGLWVREQAPKGEQSGEPVGEWILHAREIGPAKATLSDAVVFVFRSPAHRFAFRIDAARVRIGDGYWTLEDAVQTQDDGRAIHHDEFRLTTGLTILDIQNSFAAPETMSFWDLPAFITTLEGAGFSAVLHRLHWYTQLASPLLLCAMVLIAATFTLRLTQRGGGTLLLICAGLFFGFLLYFVSDLMFALGLSSKIPPTLAAWAPATVTTMIGVASLLHLEDG